MSIYGNPVTLGPRWMTAQKVSILPFQNLHGYANPWPAGGGKNLLPNTKSETYQGLNYTVRSDGGYDISGTLTVVTGGLVLYDSRDVLNIPPGSYRIVLIGQGEGIDHINLQAYVDGTSKYWGKGGTFTVSSTATSSYIRFRADTNGTVFNCTVYPMLLLSTEADTSFAPYSNICPISGWEDCQVWVSPTASPADGITYQTVFGNPPGTVYGGELDLETGVLTVTMAMMDLGNITWQTSNPQNGIYWLYGSQMSSKGIKLPTTVSEPINAISSRYKSIASAASYDSGCMYYDPTSNARYFGIRDMNYANVSTTDFATAMGDVQFVFELATPVTYQLTPQQISFFGNQYFGANCGPVLIKVGK